MTAFLILPIMFILSNDNLSSIAGQQRTRFKRRGVPSVPASRGGDGDLRHRHCLPLAWIVHNF
jgi:hypothetical protein